MVISIGEEKTSFMEPTVGVAGPQRLSPWTFGFNQLRYAHVQDSFLVAVASARHVSELQALSSDKRYLTFDSTGVTLRLNPAFIPKVDSQQNREKELSLLLSTRGFNPIPEALCSLCAYVGRF